MVHLKTKNNQTLFLILFGIVLYRVKWDLRKWDPVIGAKVYYYGRMMRTLQARTATASWAPGHRLASPRDGHSCMCNRDFGGLVSLTDLETSNQSLEKMALLRGIHSKGSFRLADDDKTDRSPG
jgi:hypothetical protein